MNIAVAVLRVQEGLDYTGVIQDFDLANLSDKIKAEIDNPAYSNTLERTITSSSAQFSALWQLLDIFARVLNICLFSFIR